MVGLEGVLVVLVIGAGAVGDSIGCSGILVILTGFAASPLRPFSEISERLVDGRGGSSDPVSR